MKKFLILTVLFMILFSFVVLAERDSAYGDPIETDSYKISRDIVDRTIRKGNIFEDYIEIENKRSSPLDVTFSVTGDITDIIKFESTGISVIPNNVSRAYFDVRGTRLGSFAGKITISGGITQEIPVNITVVEESLDPLFLINTDFTRKKLPVNKKIEFKLDIKKLKSEPLSNLSLTYELISPENKTTLLGSETINLERSLQLLKSFEFPENSKEGFYILNVLSEHENQTSTSSTSFLARIPTMQIKVFGFLKMWVLITIASTLIIGLITFILVKRRIESKKKYKMTLDMKTLPKKNKDFLWFGKIAEKKNFAYFDPQRFTTHTIVAGSTGGGKSIASQVIIEEALKKNISVIVFDPTAQWSGMLRKCEDKKMFAYYPQFGMKKNEARGFPGNIRAVKDARQIIDVNKYIEPGHIQIFTLNKLQPKDIDVFVANIIREIFKHDPKESPVLKTLLVFDEIHRILPKFGASGEGFLQIERGCREFRKWGLGIVLISQVLSDFMGEIKANISTEVQMRTRDEGDLNRIKTKYGDEFLQSLVKASTGVGMVVNPAYNHANPYFIQFRPILHNTRRLSDEELDKYNEYNDVVEDLEYQIEQLGELKVDIFDLKMELKLVKDKIMVGNFSVVDIYLEGLKPRIAKQWEKLGKKPKKLEIQLASEEDIKAAVEEARKEKEKAKAKEAKQEEAAAEAKRDPMEELLNKQLSALTFDNGVMLSTLKELIDYLPNLDEETFKIHVNAEKNDIAKWFEQISKAYGARLKSVTDKEELLKQIKAYKPPAKKVVKKDAKKEII